MSARLSEAAIQAHLQGQSSWILEDGALVRRDQPENFRAALAWINRVGMLAEEHNHHPDFHLTGWNQVELRLWSHDAGGITQSDLDMARHIDALA